MSGCEEALLSNENGPAQPPKFEKSPLLESRTIPKHEEIIPPGEYQIRHPLRGVRLIDGKVPGIDIHDDPITHKRLAIGEITTSEEDNAMKTFSGIIELERTTYERKRKGKRQMSVISSSQYPAKIKNGLKEKARSGGLLNVAIRIVADETIESIWHQLQREIGLGTIRTKADLDIEREKIMDRRRAALQVNKVPVVQELNTLGIKFKAMENLNLIHAQVPADDLKKLEIIPEVHSMRLLDRKSSDALAEACPMPSYWFNNEISGTEILQGTQIKQFLCENYDAQPSSGAYRVAMIEKGVSYCNSSKFDWKNGPSRWKDVQECGLFTCDPTAGCHTSTDRTNHATQTTALVAGDLTQEQSPTYPSTFSLLQAERSGYAPETEVYQYAVGTFGFGSAVDHLLGKSSPPLATNISWGTGTDHLLHDCIGDWDADESVNAMYEAGIFTVVAAGNDGGNGPDCRVSIPGSALAAFTVGGHGNSRFGSISDVRTGARSSFSSYGRNNAGRDVIDITAPAYRNRLPGYHFYNLPPWNLADQGTSFSAPTVTAAALDFADFYQSTYSSWILNPGALFSSMLLMGDRQTISGKALTDFDPVWGSGRMHMRMFNDKGMDGPWGYGRYGVCVGDGDEVSYTINNLWASVDSIKVVAHWYDKRHGSNGTVLDDIDLKMDITLSNGVVRTRNSNSSDNNKERVYYDLSNTGHASAKITLRGYHVTSDNAGCGQNSMRVYLSYYYEDHARNDSNGPGTEILTD